MSYAKVTDLICWEMQDTHPELKDITSASEASKIIFGVKTLTHILHAEPKHRDALLAFFGNNHSDMIEWSRHCDPGTYENDWDDSDGERYTNNFHGGRYYYDNSTFRFLVGAADMFATYKQIAKEIGIEAAVAVTQDKDANDTFAAYRFLRDDKKLWAKFRKLVVPAFACFPANLHARMIHDFGMAEMKKVEAKANRGKGRGAKLPTTMPLPETMPEVKGYKILIPRNESEMRKIGNAQNHCVGRQGMGYIGRVQSHKIWIAAIYTEALSDGICVEIDRKDGRILQAQGCLRRSPTDAEQKVIKKVNKHLTGFSKKYNDRY